MGRFASADTIIPNPGNPQDFNRFSYVKNNPLNLVDPTGHYYADSDDGEISPPIPEPEEDVSEEDDILEEGGVDITEWLIWQMKWNAQGKTAEHLRSLNEVKMLPDVITMRSAAYAKWRELVNYGNEWDFKPDFKDKRIKWVTIDGTKIRMDVVANIHYGFIGNQVGFSDTELFLGAGIAQQLGPYPEAGEISLEYLGDEPVDHWSIDLGIQLSRDYGVDFTYDEFISLFNEYLDAGLFDAYLP